MMLKIGALRLYLNRRVGVTLMTMGIPCSGLRMRPCRRSLSSSDATRSNKSRGAMERKA